MTFISVTRFTRRELEAIDDAIEHLGKSFVCKINAMDLSETFNVPLKKLQAGVLKRTGLTVHELVAEARLRKSKELLADADNPLKTIAELVGYKTASQFGYFFKKHTGLTPLKYRRGLMDKGTPVDVSKPNPDNTRPILNNL